MSALIREMDATDLVGRLVINPSGAEFVVTRLTFDARDGRVWIYVRETDDDPSAESGLPDLDGWEIHQPLTKEEVNR